MPTTSNELVQFENVSKYYRLGNGQSALSRLFTAVTKPGQSGASGIVSEAGFWSLRDVSFNLRRGEALGIIGPNGAGKTTALKILSHVTKPTSGRVAIQGRMSSLIELGAGFHPDLSGRENIYLNGAILGLRKREIATLFDRIVAFSELDRFIDTPVKRYSSGMYARLGFAVAAHVSPEILLVDEVLSVGDFGFQAKCAQRMKELRELGTAIIFVSHNMRSVHAICDSCLVLNHGSTEYLGDPAEAIERYHRLLQAPMTTSPDRHQGDDASGGAAADITRVELFDARGKPAQTFRLGETLVARIHYVAYRRIEGAVFSAGFFRSDGVHACSNTSAGSLEPVTIEGPGVVELALPDLALVPQTYAVTASIVEPRSLRPYASEQLVSFRVESGSQLIDEHFGVFVPRFRWRAIDLETAGGLVGAGSGAFQED